MSDRSNDKCPTFYQEDVSTLAAGTVLIGQPCIVWDLSAMMESSGTAVVSFSDDSTGYTAAHRISKIVFTGPDTESAGTNKGLTCTRGLSCTSNIASVDVCGIYE